MQIRIGHPAYTGANRAVYATSKAAAVDELRNRGVKRDDAREALKKAANGSLQCVRDAEGFNVIEVAIFSFGDVK